MAERLTLSVEDGTRAKLIALAGSERKIGATVSVLAAEAHARQKIEGTLVQAVFDLLQRVQRLESVVFGDEDVHTNKGGRT